MAEVFFVLLTVYVVYVVQSVICKNKEKSAPSEIKPTVVTEAVKTPEQKVVVEKVKPAAKKASIKKTASVKSTVKPKVASKPKVKAKPVSGNLRNPETGDVDKIATSYRMTKRWIKEALVTEGLLPKIYKTAELDDAAKLKANKALAQLAKMDKYQV